jgi:hypothetical protein
MESIKNQKLIIQKDQKNAKDGIEIASKEIQKNLESKESKKEEIPFDLESLLKDIPKGSKGNNSQSLYKFNPSLHPKFESIESWDIIKSQGLDKKYRSILRSKLDKFKNNILGKDRSNEERISNCKEFREFFKENYIASALHLSSIYQGSEKIKLEEYSSMIKIINHLSK